MALDPKIVKQLKRDLAEINKIYRQIGEKEISIDFDKANVDDIKLVRDYLSEARSFVSDLDEGFGGMAESIKNIVSEWKSGFSDPTKEATKSFTKLKSLAEKFSDDAKEVAEMKGKEVKDSVKLIKKENERLKVLRAQLKNQKSLNAEEQAILANLESEYQVQKDLLAQAEKRLKQEEKIQKRMGLTGAAIKGIQGTLEKIGIQSHYFDDIEDSMREAAKSGGAFKTAFAGVSGIAKALGAALTDPLVLFTLMVKAVKFLINVLDHARARTAEIAQGFGYGRDAARGMVHEIEHATILAGDMYHNTEEQIAAQLSLNKATGLNLKYNEENAKTMQDLTMYMGMSEENAGQLFRISAQMGKGFRETADEVAGIVNGLNETTGMSLTTNQVFDQIGKASASVRFNIQGGFEGMVKAAHTAARLGMSMDQIANAANSALNFENSIADEMNAELFLQKDLNLERFRAAALTGDNATMAAEMERIIKGNMNGLEGNVMAQQALAKSLGISNEELSESMLKIKEGKSLQEEQSDETQATASNIADVGKEAAQFGRTMKALGEQISAILLPVAEKLESFFSSVATFMGTKGGKFVVALAGIVAGGAIVFKAGKSLMNLFTGGGGLFGKKGDNPGNPMYVYDVNGGGGGGHMLDSVVGRLGRRWTRSMKFTKNISKVFGGKNTYMGRQLRNLSAMFGKRSSFVNQIVRNNATLSKIFPRLSTLNSKLPQDIAMQIGKTLKVDKAGNVLRMADAATDTASVASKASWVSRVLPKGLTTTLSKVGPVLTKGLKILGPVGAVADLAIGGYTGYQQSQMSAEEQRAAGVKEGIGATEATIQGVLTGGAEKGSVITEWFGGEKGSAGDELLGLGTSAARGALTPAALCSSADIWDCWYPV